MTKKMTKNDKIFDKDIQNDKKNDKAGQNSEKWRLNATNDKIVFYGLLTTQNRVKKWPK